MTTKSSIALADLLEIGAAPANQRQASSDVTHEAPFQLLRMDLLMFGANVDCNCDNRAVDVVPMSIGGIAGRG